MVTGTSRFVKPWLRPTEGVDYVNDEEPESINYPPMKRIWSVEAFHADYELQHLLTGYESQGWDVYKILEDKVVFEKYVEKYQQASKAAPSKDASTENPQEG